ncbi:MAG: hypothetical protein M3Y22_02930 [Pseudomonadota bacterium]|nr:hypothetical protein [Pseudomonadota bacterium]
MTAKAAHPVGARWTGPRDPNLRLTLLDVDPERRRTIPLKGGSAKRSSSAANGGKNTVKPYANRKRRCFFAQHHAMRRILITFHRRHGKRAGSERQVRSFANRSDLFALASSCIKKIASGAIRAITDQRLAIINKVVRKRNGSFCAGNLLGTRSRCQCDGGGAA